ncbi:hypothetical protein D9619_003932 [Psilocybe cf. subviscida]|uniref:Uncharacterized protein n=1 Tax=Psilocybe cf. subviscida TaxID=2480587 RepID=A0A8H5BQA6_9AGAR|nr:hypothetical protein D9619_003932 [Psilocybe cf. subviscida]
MGDRVSLPLEQQLLSPLAFASPDRLALFVRRYEQHTSWDASTPNSDAWSPKHTQTTSLQQRLAIIGRVAEALRLMTNFKHLSFADSHTYYHGPPNSQAGAELLLRGCNFQLHSLEWQRRDNLPFLLTDFLPSQNALRAFHLTSAYGDFSNVPQAIRDASARVSPRGRMSPLTFWVIMSPTRNAGGSGWPVKEASSNVIVLEVASPRTIDADARDCT